MGTIIGIDSPTGFERILLAKVVTHWARFKVIYPATTLLTSYFIAFLLSVAVIFPVEGYAAPANGDVMRNSALLQYDGATTGLEAFSNVTFRTLAGDETEPPTDINILFNFDVDGDSGRIIENQVGQVLGFLSVEDPDTLAGAHQFSILDDIRFEIVDGQLKLADGEFIDFETENEISITIRAVDPDGLGVDKVIVISVRDVNEAPFDLVSSNTFVVVGSPEIKIGELSVSDVDADENFTYAVIGDDRFTIIDGNILGLAAGVNLPPDTTIPVTVIVTDKGGLTTRLIAAVSTNPPARPPGSLPPLIGFMAPDSTGDIIEVPEATCSPASGFILDGGATSLRLNFAAGDLAGSRSLAPADAYAIGDPVIVSVTDAGANLQPFVKERIEVRLTIDATADSELLTLIETDIDTGVFYGFVFTTSQQSATNDCILTVASNTQVDASYTSQSGIETVTTLAAIAPVGVLFNDNTGEPINGVILALINDETGEPAAVSGDGPNFALYPSTIITGETVTDAAGGVYVNGPGEYRFPAIPDGRYRLVIFNDEGWNFSAKIDEEVQQLGGQQSLVSTSEGRFTLNVASRGEPIQVSQGAFPRIDIPVKQLARPATVEPTPSRIEFLQFSANPSVGQSVNVGQTNCVAGVSRTVSELKDVSVPVPGLVNLVPATVYKVGQPIFVRVTDIDQNFDPEVRESITIQLTVPASGDREFLQLRETEPDSGQFVGYIQSAESERVNGNCMLGVVKNESIRTLYSDIFDEADQSDSLALVDPFGKIFSTKDGRLIDGVTVTLIDTSTGQPADVFGDGPAFAPFPNPILSGGEAVDDAGVVYDFPEGEYRFPFVAAGFYQFQFSDTPDGLIFPSTTSSEAIQLLPGNPFQITDGSFGGEFEVPIGPALNIDLPVDEPLGEMFVAKTASSGLVSIGDFVQYRITVQNSVGSLISGAQLQDTLPQGFRFQKGSLRVGGEKFPDPAQDSNGRTLLVELPAVGAGELEITYVTEVTPAAEVGEALNLATVQGALVTSSNTAFARVIVTDELFSQKAFLIGRVIFDTCETATDKNQEVESDVNELPGIAGVRIYLEDGSYVVTDDRGFWHMEGIEPGAHVVQMDTDSLAARYEASPCNDNSRFAGSPYSQFVDIKGGTLWRTDFKIQDKPTPESEVKLTQSLKVDGDGVFVEIDVTTKGSVPLASASVIYNVPKKWQVVKGSEVLNGEATSSTSSIVGTVFNLGAVVDRQSLRFVIEPKDVKFAEQIGSGANEIMVLRPRFATRSARLGAKDKEALDQMISALSRNDWQQITIIGHSDNVPIAPQNQNEFVNNKALSQARAAAVAEYLAEKVKTRKLVVVGAGDQYPIASNETIRGRASNRRVELLLKPVVRTRQVVAADALNGESRARLSFSSAGTPKAATDSSKLPLNRLVGGFDKLSSSVFGQALGSWDSITKKEVIEIAQRDPDVQGFMSIRDGTRLGNPIRAVKLDLDSRLKPKLMLDGEEISVDRIGYKSVDEYTGKTIYSYIGVDFGDPGPHVLKVEGIGPFGNVRYSEEITVVRAGELKRINFVSAEGNIADGTTPVKVRFELLDSAGEPLGIPYKVNLTDTKLRRFTEELSLSELAKISDRNFVDVDASGFVSFDPVSISGSYKFTLEYNDFSKEFEVYVEPEKRKWIMVGLAEGTTAYNDVSGNMENLVDAGLKDELDTEGRVAFYAKGQVKGEYILTMAYDTDKADKNSLEQTIDPNSYYTLYGDAGTTRYDAASQEKLFLKLEKNQFYALFGDFTTALDGGELSKYSRSLSGLKTEYQGDRFDVVVFASETDQAFLKDEIRGDGTSGIYRISNRDLVINSEKIHLEVRDRFHSEDILETKELRRHVDYNIDYNAGTLFFKEPVFSQDAAFNPRFIVIDYELRGDGAEEMNYGGRIAYSPTEDIEVGLTLVKEGVEGREGELAALDFEYRIDDKTDITAEVAGTTSSFEGLDIDGSAYNIEARRQTEKLDTRAYVREQQGAFGLGQQNDSETGTRKIGMVASYEIADGIQVAGEVYRDANLVTGRNQDVATSSMRVSGDNYTVSSGLRSAVSRGDAEDQVSNQLLLGGTYKVLDGKLVLNANADTPIANKSEAGDFPKRLRVGLDYKLSETVTLQAEQEFSWGDDADTQGTRIGMSTSLWQGGDLVTSVTRSDEENSQRLAAVAGLKQRWDLNENWSFDFGVDRSQTIKNVSKAPPPLTVTTVFSSPSNDDFTSITFGSKFKKDAWDWATRVEYKDADSEDKINLVTDVIHNLDEGQQLLAKLNVQRSDSADSESTSMDIQLGYSFRPDDSRWTVFNRLDLRHNQNQSIGFDVTSQKIINNLNANYILSDDTQIALQYGLKYVVDNFDDDEYRGFTDLYGMEVRHDLNKSWDVGFQGSLYNSWNSNVSDYSYGVSVGYNMARNVWVSLGYNFDGFQDEDFSASEYTSEGIFLKYRLKFDQDTANSILGLMGN
ncbi:MAG: putative repeat protein (TIGR01451 family) [Candidatus Azotimanducaceae bacterium]|jgi:uncharacterized repeat protein (TIGR01451 family)